MAPVRVTASEYRGKRGFTISQGKRPWGTRIFVRTTLGAQIVKAALKLEAGAIQDTLIDCALIGGL